MFKPEKIDGDLRNKWGCQAKNKGENVLDGEESIFSIFGSKTEQGILED